MFRSEKMLNNIIKQDNAMFNYYYGTLQSLACYSRSLDRNINKALNNVGFILQEHFTFDHIIQGDRAEDCNDIDFLIENLQDLVDEMKNVKEIKKKAQKLAYRYHKDWVDLSNYESITNKQ